MPGRVVGKHAVVHERSTAGDGGVPFERVELPPEIAALAPGADHDGVGSAVFGENNLKTRLRSHPDVARRHYADLG